MKDTHFLYGIATFAAGDSRSVHRLCHGDAPDAYAAATRPCGNRCSCSDTYHRGNGKILWVLC